MENVFNQLANILNPNQTKMNADIIAVGDFYGKTIVIEVTDMNPRKENVFAGRCIASDCELNPVGSTASNWDKGAFSFYTKNN